MVVLKKTIGIPSKKSLKFSDQGEALVVWSKADARKKTRGSDQPWPPAPYFVSKSGVLESLLDS